MTTHERTWILGTGAVGSSLAALLTRAGGCETIVVGRSPHWQAIQERGLIFEPHDQPATTIQLPTQSPTDIPDLSERDLVLLCGKVTRLKETLTPLKDRISRQTPVVAFQNGLGIGNLASVMLGRPVDRGLVYFGAHIPAPGHVRFFPGIVKLSRSPATEALASRLSHAGMEATVIDDVKSTEWAKLAINCLANPLAALLTTDNAGVGSKILNPVKKAMLDEVRAVAAAEGVEMQLTIDQYNGYTKGPTGGNLPSMLSDIQRQEPTEIAFINGAVVRLGKHHKIPTPVNEAMVSLILFLSTQKMR